MQATYRLSIPANAIDVENFIRSHCSHFGYPGSMITSDGNELVLTINEPDPLPTPGAAVEGRTVPKVFC